MSTAARSRPVGPTVSAGTSLMPLWALLVAGFLIRLLFIGSNGFHNDVAAFESWAMTLRDNPPWAFYTKSTFADYPPGYFIVLWIIGHLYALLPGANADAAAGWPLLRDLVKLPAILMDLVNAGILFAIVRRYASQTVALIAAGFLALNPAAIYVSAYWGQVDSVSWGLVLLTLYLVLRAGDDVAKTASRLTLAWVVFAFSLLIKPQAATFGALLLVYPFATLDAGVRRARLIGTAGGVVGALVLTWLVTILFHANLNPVADFSWLLQRYEFGSSVYKYTSVNAFNLYAIRYHFWSPDTTPLHFGFGPVGFDAGPLSLWGVILVLASTILIAGRYLQRKDDRALIEGALLLALSFFCLATRMHERYIYGAFLLATPLIAFGTAGLWSSVVLTVTMYMNLAYSLYYQTVMENHTTGVDATDLWPYISNLASLANVLVFFILGYLYLGGSTPVLASATATAGGGRAGGTSIGATFGGTELAALLRAMSARMRAWFSPIEGLAAMTRLDHLLAWGLGVFSFVQCILYVWYPAERYFDEVYYPRAGEEYIKHLDVSGWGPFEFTHPPFTKLLITASMLLNGGLTHDPHGSSFGWRFLNVVVGALTIPLLYAFAKRLTASTLFATIASGMLIFDGFHYVQSRISTPEITVAFWSLATLYAFYRLWIASGIRRIRVPDVSAAWVAGGITMGIGLIVGIGLYLLVPDDHIFGPHPHSGGQYVGVAQNLMLLYVLMVFWLITRLIVLPRVRAVATETSYADGTRIIEPTDGDRYAIVNQNEITLGRGAQAKQKNAPALGRTLAEDGTMTYATPDGVGTYTPAGVATFSGGLPALKATDARIWWVLLAVSAAFVADSKWNGLLDFLVVWMFVGLIWLQRYIRRDSLWGNPFGMPVDIIVTGMLVVSGFIYTLSYIPFFIPFATGAHGYVDMIAMQQDMYHYHSTLVATHPYASKWWQWPLILKPISYYWHDFRTDQANAAACCVAEILALPNPFIWWFGAITVPIVGWLAWSERNKGYAVLFAAYLWHWLPWARSPRLEFEYHFYPNLAMIVLCNAIVLQRIWHWRADQPGFTPYLTWPRVGVLAYCLVVVAAFFFFLPVLSAWPMTWDSWHARMWLQHWVI